MQLPNKLYSYNNSIMPLLPIILIELQRGPISLDSLYFKTKKKIKDPTDFLFAMDCLFALRKVILDDNGEVSIC